MSNLRPNLFDTDFDQLVQLGRSLLPKLAPAWTDHNLHDPGIMLIELLAWTAEAQIYSLARLRSDERWAYGALLGFTPRGPLPATGLVWPGPSQAFPDGAVLPAAQAVTPDQPQALAFRLSHPVNLTAARLVGVESRLRDGRVLNQTATNDRPGGAYYPFGERADAGDRFVLTFEGPLLAPGNAPGRKAFLSFGVRVPTANPADPASATQEDGMAKDAACSPVPQARLVATLRDGLIRYPLRVEMDGTDGFLRTGAILLDLSQVPGNLRNGRFSIEFQSRGAGLVGPPRIVRIQPNVLLVEQQAKKQTPKKQTPPLASNGLPDQTLVLEEAGVRYGAACLLPTVSVGVDKWRRVDDLAACGPAERVFSFDPATRQIRFGNGVNGQIPPLGSALEVEYEVTEGVAGNLPAGLKWTVQGLAGTFTNPDPTTGGLQALNLSDLRRLARDSVRRTHAVVTSADLEHAALSLADLRVARAVALAAPDQGTRCPALLDTRTLVALRARLPGEDYAAMPENPRWLEEVRRQLAGRLPLGERLRVVAPDYLALRINATLLAHPGYDPKKIQDRAGEVLAGFFTLLPGSPGDTVWPLGRPVESLDVSARLRKIEGVLGVKDCVLSWPLETPVFSNRFLPLLQTSQSRIDVLRPATESAP